MVDDISDDRKWRTINLLGDRSQGSQGTLSWPVPKPHRFLMVILPNRVTLFVNNDTFGDVPATIAVLMTKI